MPLQITTTGARVFTLKMDRGEFRNRWRDARTSDHLLDLETGDGLAFVHIDQVISVVEV